MSEPDNRRNLLLVDNSVSNYIQIVNSVNTSISDVLVFNSNEHTYADLITMIHAQNISGGYKSIGILQHNMRLPYHQMLNTEKKCVLLSVELNDPTLSSWVEYIDFISVLKTNFSISFLDLLACALYSDNNWKYVIDTIADRLQITIRASTDDTGAVELGGDWYLESQTGANLKDVYFTDAIDNYAGVLDMGFAIVSNSQGNWPNMIIAPSTLAVWGNSLTTTILSTALSQQLVNITKVFSFLRRGTTHNVIFALNTNGVLFGFGNKTFGTQTLNNILNVELNSGFIDYFAQNEYIGLLKSNGTVVFLTDGNDATAFMYYTTFTVSNAISVYNFVIFNNDTNRRFGVLDSSSTFRLYTGPRNQNDSSASLSNTITDVARVFTGYGSDRHFILLKRDRTIADNWNEITWTNVANIYICAVSYAGISLFGIDTSNNLLYTSYANGYNYDGLSTNNAPLAARTNVATVKTSAIDSNTIGLILQLNGNVTGWSKINIGSNFTFTSQTYEAVAIYITRASTNDTYRVIQAALKYDGTLYIRGGTTSSNQANTYSVQPVIDVVPGHWYIAFLLNNGNVILHTSSNTFVTIVNTNNAVALYIYDDNSVNVILNNGSLIRYYNGSITYDTSVVTYNGSATQSSTILNTNVTGVVPIGGLQAAAIQTSSSLSSFNKFDLFQYFLSRNNRRINNFNSLNGTYTIDDYRTITLINPFLPTNKSYTLIIPDYQSSANLASSPYNIKSNVTLDDSVACFITAIDEGEQFTINGITATTYVLHHPYVYTVATSPSFALTKVSSITTAYNTFVIYGDGGFAGVGNPVLPKPTLSSFYPSGISKTFGDAAFDLTDPSSNNTTGAFTYTSSNSNVAIITGGGSSKNVTIIGAGTTTITATQAATAEFATHTITTTLTVSLATPTLSSSTFTVRSSATYGADGDISFGITTAPTSNNTDVSITYASNDTNVATINASTGVITPVGFGSVTFTANQVAVATKYEAASVTSNSLSVARGTTTLTRVSMNSSITKTFGVDSETFDISTNSLSVGAITYTSSEPSFATVNINTGTVTLVAAGTTILTAQQAQTAQYNAPADISSSLVVNRGTTSLTRVSFGPTISKTYGESAFSVSVSSASNGTKTYTSSDLSCATIDSNGLVTLVASGSTTLTISQAQSSQYEGPSDISAVLTVDRATTVLTRTTFPTTIAKTYGDTAFTLVVTSTNTDIPVEYTSGTPGVATVNSSTGQVTLVSSGTTTITASQPQTSRYYSPTSITTVLTVSRANVSLTGFPTSLSKNVTDEAFTITATSISSGTITYESGTTSVATIDSSSGLVTL